MHFEEWHAGVIKKIPRHPLWKYWVKTFLFSLCILAFFLLYLFARTGSLTLFTLNQAVANNALFLIGLSMMLSSLCYFWNFIDTKIIYRKYLGVIGAVYGFFHIGYFFQLLWRRATNPRILFSEGISTFFGLAAIILFLFMIVISSRYAIHELGSARWRKMLRYAGYIGFVFLLFHLLLVEYDHWIDWIISFKPSVLPPLSLLSMIFGIVVIGIRFTLWISLMRKKQAVVTSKNGSVNI